MLGKITGFMLAGASLAVLPAIVLAQDHPLPPAGTVRPAATLDNEPSVTISNGQVSAKVYMPEPRGFYTGTRFDHAGMVTHTTYKGQDYAKYWFSGISSAVHDYTYDERNNVVAHPCCAATGPVEEFDAVGFDQAERSGSILKRGGSFLKIGVGILRRNTDAYDHVLNYPIVNAGTRENTATGDSVRFVQAITGDPSGYGYHYVKTVRLVPGRAQMLIEHVLRNTGTKPIETSVYCHNFLTLSTGNENIRLTAPFALKNARALDPDVAKVDGNSFRYLRAMTGWESVSSGFTGFGGSSGDYDFRIENTKTGYGIRIRADQPLAQINMWSVTTTFSWEPYVAISLKPGQEKRWTYIYDFFAKGDKT
jgi:hypothetical protein